MSGSGSGGASGSAGSSEYFVGAVVDGVPTRAEWGVQAYWFKGLLDGWLMVEGHTDDRVFNLLVMNALSSDACSYMVFGDLPRTSTTDRGSFVEGGSCSVKVTATAPNIGDVLEGTFSGLVGAIGVSRILTVTDGRFRAPRPPDNSPAGP
jgi:hypothetical protein